MVRISHLDRARAKMAALQERIARLEDRAARIAEIAAYIKSGDSYASIARSFGLSRQRIHAIAKRHGLGGGRKATAVSLENA